MTQADIIGDGGHDTGAGSGDLTELMARLGTRARAAARSLATAPAEAKDRALREAANALRANTDAVLAENARDVAAARGSDVTEAYIDRLTLTAPRIAAIADALDNIALLPDPVGSELATWTRPNGLEISRVRTPLGVVGIIYESRPNVTADAGGLCLKSGNAAILRAGSDSQHSSRAILGCLQAGLAHADLPAAAIQLVPTTDRAAVGLMLSGLDGAIDVIVPRGGKSLVARVQAEARVPVFAHLEGICHVFVDRGVDLEEAIPVIVNAKMRRTGVCGAAECILIDQAAPEGTIGRIVSALVEARCEVRGDHAVQAVDERVVPATDDDFGHEFLDSVVAIKTVDGVDGAIAHISEFGSGHTEAILTECYGTAETFLRRVDSAIVMHNASTQFADGGEFGMGAEIGIATGKMHARGPVGVEQLTSFKYVVRGTGQTRPV